MSARNYTMGLYGRKLGMTQIFDDVGNTIGTTIVEITPNRVIQVKTSKSGDGYAAIQLGFGTRRERLLSRPIAGHLKKAGSAPVRFLREVRMTDAQVAAYSVGQELTVAEIFQAKSRVDVSGTIKGRGFTGVMKRYNFSGFKRTHGAHEYKRHGGSIGTRLTPGMTLSGMPMPGRYGQDEVTIQNLLVLKVDAEKHLIYIKGGIPGPNGGYLRVRKAIKDLK